MALAKRQATPPSTSSGHRLGSLPEQGRLLTSITVIAARLQECVPPLEKGLQIKVHPRGIATQPRICFAQGNR